MIRAAAMNDDFYVYDEDHMKLVGERTHKEYVLGQKVMIKVLGADRITRTIDFRIVSENESDDEFGYDPDDFVVFSDARKVAESRANKVRKLIERSQSVDDDTQAKGRIIEYEGRLIDLNDYEPDSRTGELKPKHKDKDKRFGKGAGKSSKSKAGKSSAGKDKTDSKRKVYKVHKYKKSATSKAARSAQGKGKKRK